MKNNVTSVGIAEGRVIQKTGVLVSYALGSCVGICLYDRIAGIAGMVHVLLPYQKDSINQENLYKFADTGLELLVQRMVQTGADRGHLTAKIAGGARMFAGNDSSEAIGERNVRATKNSLAKLGIRLVAEDTGKDYGRTIRFDAENGMLEISTAKKQILVI